jgi:hypothetical protein
MRAAGALDSVVNVLLICVLAPHAAFIVKYGQYSVLLCSYTEACQSTYIR